MKSLSLIISTLVLSLAVQSGYAANVGDPEEVNIKVYGFWASENSDCSNLQEVFTESAPSYQNMAGNPTFGSGTLNNGTYNCIAIKMSDAITGRPGYNSDHGNCIQGNLLSQNVFRGGDLSSCPDGTNHTGSNGEETPCLYISTTGSDSSDNPFSSSTPFELQNPWVVSADTTGTFVSDFTGKIEDDGSECEIEAPTWNFR